MIRALLSHPSKAHSSCGAPVRRAQMIQLPFKRPLSCSLLSFPFFRALCLFWEHSNLLLPCTLSSSPPPPPLPAAASPESGRPRRHHSPLADNRHKGGLGGPGCGRSMCTATGESGGKSPTSPDSLQSSIVPTSSDDENSVSAD